MMLMLVVLFGSNQVSSTSVLFVKIFTSWTAGEGSTERNVIRLTTVHGTEFLLQAPDTETGDSWAEVIGDTIRQLEQDKTIANPMVAECDIRSTARPLLDAHNSELIAAMQDPDAGIALGEHKSALKTYKDCFAGVLCVLSLSKFTCTKILFVACEGCELSEWLLSWSFVTMREEGCQLANSLLNESYLEPVGGSSKELFKKHSHSKKLAFVDCVEVLYRFSALTPSKPVEQCFSTLSRNAELTSSETGSGSECGMQTQCGTSTMHGSVRWKNCGNNKARILNEKETSETQLESLWQLIRAK
ncbi:uncharacterized protein LOC134176623 isoform X2 [Corticium candelabrum]|uniref:uncharacterized protein LOC134176623 isoform X2 n=1 Tax=Corticium candelabrum TaxID=121492 RepID=UPI002E26DA93|nr:uncharacterized protein LOC134176623 isoform X2 [Corticium candelabrum]XP_062499277.1 uncharacterized protein LOC134176623 isoform X2 [Corticium candelabrum]XP_062499278.1 uncharacterized protein LOC134176623 isoform X2 [Corticium candelabrum]